MIPNKPGACVRSLMAAVVACASLVQPAGTRAQEPSDGRSEGVIAPVAAGGAGAAVAPRITGLSRTFTGTVHEEFRLDIRFSQEREPASLSDDIEHTFTLKPDPDHL